MTSKPTVAVLCGSLRRDSDTRKLAHAIAAAGADRFDARFVAIADLPLYDPDLDDAPPAPWVRLRDEVRGVDAVMFVSPEYNRSIPAGLKNAIDVGSRPYGQSVWAGKPCAVVTGSPSGLGGVTCNHQIRQALVWLDMPVMQQPEAYVSGINTMFGPDGAVLEPTTQEFIAKLADGFADWIARVGPVPARAA